MVTGIVGVVLCWVILRVIGRPHVGVVTRVRLTGILDISYKREKQTHTCHLFSHTYIHHTQYSMHVRMYM